MAITVQELLDKIPNLLAPVPGKLCRTCEHDGQCEGLYYCNGKYYSESSEEDNEE